MIRCEIDRKTGKRVLEIDSDLSTLIMECASVLWGVRNNLETIAGLKGAESIMQLIVNLSKTPPEQ